MDSIIQVIQWLQEESSRIDVALGISSPTIWLWLLFFFTLFISGVVWLLVKRISQQLLKKISTKTQTSWDDILFKNRVINPVVMIIPIIVTFNASRYIFSDRSHILSGLQQIMLLLIMISIIQFINRMVDTLIDIAQTTHTFKNKPVKSYGQLMKIINYFFSSIVIFSIILNKNPAYLLSGLGAMTAIILLIFKDSILGFVSSIQIAANDTIRTGDWIEMPKYGADGNVVDVTLNTIKVQNWDKTITTIPTYAVSVESVKNWRGMSDSGGRRIKRALNIDITTIRFLNASDIEALKNIELLREYLEQKEEELTLTSERMDINDRQLTNLGTFRAYIQAYLRKHQMIHKDDFTFLVRQLPPGETGVGIEIYVFSKEQRWVEYESIQADIFDHLLAVISVFDLSVFQRPSGNDFQRIIS